MHELALCGAIADTVAEHANGRGVRRVHVRIGHFRQVVPDTLTFCWEMQTRGTGLECCELEVDYVPAVVACRTCGVDTTLDAPLMICGSCDGVDVRLTSGEEFLINSIDVASEHTTTHASTEEIG